MDDLGTIRHWSNLRIAFEQDLIWLKGFSEEQLNSVEVKSIWDKKVYYEKDAKLFLKDSLLPDRNIPSLLWSGIDRGLPVKLSSLNHNFFGLEERLKITIVPSEIEREAVAMAVSLSALESYITTAPAIRLKGINWAIIKPNIAFLLGRPLLPVSGEVYWQKDDFIIPAGYDINPPLLTNAINSILNPEGTSWIIWNKDSSYFVIGKNQYATLSLSSFRRTVKDIYKAGV